jgi:hypothetical protein
VELGRLRQQVLTRGSLTGINYKQMIPSLFGWGGAATLIFHGQGAERLQVDLVKPKIAQEIMKLLGY